MLSNEPKAIRSFAAKIAVGRGIKLNNLIVEARPPRV